MNSGSAILPLEWTIRPAAARVWAEWVGARPHCRVSGTIEAVADGNGASPTLLHAVTACAQALSAIGAGLAITGDGGVLEPLLASDPEAGELEELQFALGEGPGRDAIRADAPVPGV